MGGGIDGLMAAIALHRQGHNWRVFERSRQAQDAGMGFIVLPEGIRSLERFGVQLTGEVTGTPLTRHLCRNAAGGIVLEQAMPLGTLGIRRRDLIGALMLALSAGGNVVLDGELFQMETAEDSRVVAAHLKSSTGDFRIHAYVFFGAPGVNSPARQAPFPRRPTTTPPLPAMVGLVRCP